MRAMTLRTFLNWQQFFRQQQAAAGPVAAGRTTDDPARMQAILDKALG